MVTGRLIKKTSLFIGLAAGFAAISPLANAVDNLVGDKVVLRALDKVTATTKDYTVAVGDTLKYGSLEIDVKHCEKKRPEYVPETYAFLQVFEGRGKTDSQAVTVADDGAEAETEIGADGKIFSGWMFASSPALSALEHGVYDIWVLDCIIPLQDENLSPDF